MQKKVLFTAKIDSHIRHFHIPFFEQFKKHDFLVHVASEGDEQFDFTDKKVNVKFGINPFSKSVVKSYKEIKNLLDKYDYDIIHTHTAIASVITRLAAHRYNKKSMKKSRVIYTAHGFHFLKGGSILSWILYFPIEYLFSKITDDLIVINSEDYNLATKFKMGKRRHYIPGVGVNINNFKTVRHYSSDKTFHIVYVAELNNNKNQILLINAVEELLNDNFNVELWLVGNGINETYLENYIIEQGLENKIKLFGYRTDVAKILSNSDLLVSTSKREGLPINIIEGMASGLPIIATKCRGHIDLVMDDENGYLTGYNVQEIREKILSILLDEKKYVKFSKNSEAMSKKYSLETIIKQMNILYFDN